MGLEKREKGLSTLIKKSKEKKDQKWNLWSGKSSVSFHGSCRKRYAVSSTNPTSTRISQPGPSALSSPVASSLIPDFNFTELCLICGQSLDRAHKRVSTIKQNYVKDRIIDVAARRSDQEGRLVMQCLQAISCIASVQVSYHKKCYDRFIILPSTEPKIPKIGAEVQAIVDTVRSHIEESGKFQFKYSELQEIIGEMCLSSKVLLNKLKQKYGDEIYISQHRGRDTIIYYKTFNVSKICSDWFCNEGSLGEMEKKTILTVAAEILRDEILNFTYDSEKYSAPSKFLDNVIGDIPPLLLGFLGDLLLGEKTENIEQNFIKRDYIAHTIVSLLRPKSFISNLQLALGTYVYRKTGSRLIINILSKLGLFSSYHSIQLHEASTIMDPPTMNIDDAFVQFVFDNTDHNVRTLDGHATFHCLGGIAVYTPDFEVCHEGGSKKCKTMPSASVLASQKRIETIPCGTFNANDLESIKFVSTDKLRLGTPPLLSPSYSAYLWAKFLKIPKLPTWKGFMEVFTNDITYSRSLIHCLPFINEPPSKLTTLNTSLHHSVAETQKLNQKTCFVTFDQPLYFKARSIVAQSAHTDLKNVIVRLGGFHLLMSYLGAIGYIMSGSGLEELWSVACASESVKKMLDGHAFSRAVRAHILSFTSLGIIICESINDGQEFNDFTKTLFENWDSEPPLMGDYNAEPTIKRMTEAFVNKLHHPEKNGPTSKLWIQYFKCVTFVLQFIEAERLGNWSLHLQSIEKMLPLFHASGHFAYAKSVQIYLQDMTNLENVMDPVEFDKFTKEGYC